ncbi:hypothetical protein [Komagataeibacter medellinensis]|uniref:hypothetical protein n=1 Tax=Komagataeibacter medellinensis TaxID=1177712 RepID=UPI001297E256|nr:hypothetical protein [Komagataeibacter medellinensis]
MKKYIIAISIFSLSGCAGFSVHSPNYKESTFEDSNAYDECKRKYPEKKGYYLKLSNCKDSVDYTWSEKNNYSTDAITDITSARHFLSKSLDAGEITPDEAKYKFSKAIIEANAKNKGYAVEENEQKAERRRAAYSVMARSGAFLSRPVYQAPVPTNMMGLQPLQHPTNATPRTTNCQSYISGSYVNTTCR